MKLKIVLTLVNITPNVPVLCAVGDFGNENFNTAQTLIRITNVQLTTIAPIAQNTCYRLAGFSEQKLNRRTKEKSIKNERWQKWF